MSSSTGVSGVWLAQFESVSPPLICYLTVMAAHWSPPLPPFKLFPPKSVRGSLDYIWRTLVTSSFIFELICLLLLLFVVCYHWWSKSASRDRFGLLAWFELTATGARRPLQPRSFLSSCDHLQGTGNFMGTELLDSILNECPKGMLANWKLWYLVPCLNRPEIVRPWTTHSRWLMSCLPRKKGIPERNEGTTS